jgi:hypothetical protein
MGYRWTTHRKDFLASLIQPRVATLCPFVEAEHAAVAVLVHLHGHVERHPQLQFSEEVHHAGIARQDFKHHLVLDVAPPSAVVHVSPDDPDRVLVTVEGLKAAHDTGRPVELHLLDDPVELFGLLSRRDWLREGNRAS